MQGRNNDSEKYLSSGSIFNLGKVSRPFRRAFVSGDSSSQQTYAAMLDDVRRLLSHAALGEWEAAEAIWNKDPSLLTIPGTVYHPNFAYAAGNEPVAIPEDKSLGRYKFVNCTAWQIALRNEEYDEADLMGKYMTDEEKKKQFLQIFPDGDMQYPQNLAKAKELLQKLSDAVSQDQSMIGEDQDVMNGVTRKALNDFYDYIRPNPECQTGLIFDPNIYLAALRKYENDFDKFDWKQRRFWCTRVEEGIASVLATGYLRTHLQYYTPKCYHRRGCLITWDGKETPYFAFRRPLSSPIPGYHFFIGNLGREYVKGVHKFHSDAVEKLYREKSESKDECKRQYSPARWWGCVVS